MAKDRRALTKKLDNAVETIAAFLDQIEPACTSVELKQVDVALMNIKFVSNYLDKTMYSVITDDDAGGQESK